MRPLLYPLTVLSLVLFLFPFVVNGQGSSQVEIKHADRFISQKIKGKEVRKLVGNVELQQDETHMFCDSALFYPDRNVINAFGNINIRQGDSLNMYGKRLDYDGNTKHAVLSQDVRLTDMNMTLVTDRLDYDLSKRIAYYQNGGEITDGESKLTSKKGYYYSSSRDMFFRQDVVLTNPQYTMNCDTLQYNIRSRKAFFHGPTTITSKKDLIYCETGWYDTKRNLAQFGKNAYLRSESQYLYGDSLYYDRNKAFGKAKRNIRVLDTAEHLLIEGHYAEHYENSRETFITQQVLVTQGMEDDSLYMSADTIRSSYDTSGRYRILRGFQRVKLYNKQFQAVCDSILYSFADSIIDMREKPAFWFGLHQATASHMLIRTQRNKITQADLIQDALVVSQEDSLHYTQIKGRDMTGLFKDNKLYHVDVKGNGESIYYIRDEDSAYIGMNHITSSDIKIGVKDNQITRINFVRRPDAILKPMKEVVPSEALLPGFIWRIKERPRSIEDLRATAKPAIKPPVPVIKKPKKKTNKKPVPKQKKK